ncbi:hypothetical protein EIP91_008288 [Steccherinum ochraceum]|uniref:Uncharacterized protein n=1 Tax=Steccherinum ochraceum TaxID=92696 RepID=A0A4V2MV91_9APHY|nr:hypothetical protein EIP91_008288 [Steccherinum ochraceum]
MALAHQVFEDMVDWSRSLKGAYAATVTMLARHSDLSSGWNANTIKSFQQQLTGDSENGLQALFDERGLLQVNPTRNAEGSQNLCRRPNEL